MTRVAPAMLRVGMNLLSGEFAVGVAAGIAASVLGWVLRGAIGGGPAAEGESAEIRVGEIRRHPLEQQGGRLGVEERGELVFEFGGAAKYLDVVRAGAQRVERALQRGDGVEEARGVVGFRGGSSRWRG